MTRAAPKNYRAHVPLHDRAKADRFALDLILDCERAASRRNPCDCDPTQWSRSAWHRFLYAFAHAPEPHQPAAYSRTLTSEAADLSTRKSNRRFGAPPKAKNGKAARARLHPSPRPA
jgi:hypothetical protein